MAKAYKYIRGGAETPHFHAEGPHAALEERKAHWAEIWSTPLSKVKLCSPGLERLKGVLRDRIDKGQGASLKGPRLRKANLHIPLGKSVGQDCLDPAFVRGSGSDALDALEDFQDDVHRHAFILAALVGALQPHG